MKPEEEKEPETGGTPLSPNHQGWTCSDPSWDMRAAQSPFRLGYRGWVCRFPSWCLCLSRQKSIERSNIPHSHAGVNDPPCASKAAEKGVKVLGPVSSSSWEFPEHILLFKLCPTCTAPRNVWHLPEPPPAGKVTLDGHPGVPGIASLCESSGGARGGLRSRSFHRKKTLWEEERELSHQHCRGSVTLREQLWVVSHQWLPGPFIVSVFYSVIALLQADRDLLTQGWVFGQQQLASGKSHISSTQLLSFGSPKIPELLWDLPFPVIIPKDFPGCFPVTDQAPPFPGNFWGTHFSPSAPARSCGRREPEPRTERIWLRQKCRSQWWKQLPGCKNCLCPTPWSPAGKGRHKTITTAATKPQSCNLQPVSERKITTSWKLREKKKEKPNWSLQNHLSFLILWWTDGVGSCCAL